MRLGLSQILRIRVNPPVSLLTDFLCCARHDPCSARDNFCSRWHDSCSRTWFALCARVVTLLWVVLYYIVAVNDCPWNTISRHGRWGESPEAVYQHAATNSLLLRTKFDAANKVNKADFWLKWLRHFDCYRITLGLKIEMGECVDDIITTLHVKEEITWYT